MSRLQQRSVVVAGVHLNYLERPARAAGVAGPPVVLLHGLLATAETFGELVGLLPEDRRIVALDLLSAKSVHQLGHPRDELEVSLAPLAALVFQFLQELGLERPILVGHSHGGLLSLQIAATERDALAGLVLLCPAHPFGGYRSHVVNFYLKAHGRALALSIPLAPSWAILRAFNEAAGPGSRITVVQLQPYLRVLRHRATLRRVLEMLATWDADMRELRRLLSHQPIATSTLLFWGDCDEVVPLSSASALEQHLTASELVVLPGMGHLLAEEAPQACARNLVVWLAKICQVS